MPFARAERQSTGREHLSERVREPQVEARAAESEAGPGGGGWRRIPALDGSNGQREVDRGGGDDRMTQSERVEVPRVLADAQLARGGRRAGFELALTCGVMDVQI